MVYDRAGELGAFRYGDGATAPIGFDLIAVERRKRSLDRSAERPNGRPRAWT